MTVREARLKPEYAAEYPDITPEVWMSAKELARNLVARVHARRKQGLFTRTFDPTHFDFRGGDALPRRRHRTRSTDIRGDGTLVVTQVTAASGPQSPQSDVPPRIVRG
jgi:hypothetical protein